jgi:hypothetical protein
MLVLMRPEATISAFSHVRSGLADCPRSLGVSGLGGGSGGADTNQVRSNFKRCVDACFSGYFVFEPSMADLRHRSGRARHG